MHERPSPHGKCRNQWCLPLACMFTIPFCPLKTNLTSSRPGKILWCYQAAGSRHGADPRFESTPQAMPPPQSGTCSSLRVNKDQCSSDLWRDQSNLIRSIPSGKKDSRSNTLLCVCRSSCQTSIRTTCRMCPALYQYRSILSRSNAAQLTAVYRRSRADTLIYTVPSLEYLPLPRSCCAQTWKRAALFDTKDPRYGGGHGLDKPTSLREYPSQRSCIETQSGTRRLGTYPLPCCINLVHAQAGSMVGDGERARELLGLKIVEM
ncbi:hypothetical protein V8F33_005070 [Rhypophila sp. PSN 637]